MCIINCKNRLSAGVLNNFESVHKNPDSGELKEFPVQQFKLSYIIPCKIAA
jgi:hypothetical protein